MSPKDTPLYIKIISVHVGCMLRLERLKRKLSQHQVGLKSGIDSISVGRIERVEYNTAWFKIMLICNVLGLEFKELFVLKSKEELLSIVDECFSLETKLTQEKKKYYTNLRNKIEELFLQKG